MISPQNRQVRSVLAEGNVRLAVPNFQRGYAWRDEEADDLWQDLINAIQEKSYIFLGTVVFDVSKKHLGTVSIVDGQQRITTIFILLAACREVAKDRKDSRQANTIQAKLAFVDDTTGETSGSRILVSKSIRDIFDQTIVNSEWDGQFPQNKKRQVKRIRPVYEFFVKSLKNRSTPSIEKILEAIYSSFFVVIEINDTKEAFDIFERTNARGIELDAADLLKNFLFAEEAADDLETRWDQVINNASGSVGRMLKYFWVSKNGYVPKKKLYDKLKAYGAEVGATPLLSDLESFSVAYWMMLKGSSDEIKTWLLELSIPELKKEYNVDTVVDAIEALRLFRVTQATPLIVAAINALLRQKEMDKEKCARSFIHLLRTLENYHFINSAVCKRPGNEVEKFYSDECQKLAKITKGKDYLSALHSIVAALKGKLAKENEFTENFKELSYESGLTTLYYFFDRLNNRGRKGGQRIKIYNPDVRIIKKNYNIEHLLSQDPSAYKLTKEKVNDFVHEVGNLLAISLHTNSELQNKPIEQKVKILKRSQSHLPMVVDFLERYGNKKYSSEESLKTMISARTKQLMKMAYKECWTI